MSDIETDKQQETAHVACQSEFDCYMQLLPCHFCGSVADVEVVIFGCDNFYSVKCKGAGCYASGPVHANKEKAIERWNTRTEVWFDIEKHEPELNTWCFISDGKGTHFAAYMDKLGFLGVDGEALDSCVKYWKPLPQAPKDT